MWWISGIWKHRRTVDILIFLICLALLILRGLRQRQRHRRVGPLIEDPAALAAAEAAVSMAPDLRQQVREGRSLIQNFSSMNGYTELYMQQLCAFLQRHGMPAAYYFLEAMPTGAIAVIGPAGTFELYVPRGSESAALELVQRFRQQ